MKEPDVLKIREVAGILHVHWTTVRKMIDKQGLRAWKVGTDIRFFRKDVMAWIDEQEQRFVKPPTTTTHSRRKQREKWRSEVTC